MKNLILILTMLAFLNSNAQFIKPAEVVSTNISILIDPKASYKEGGLNYGFEINYTEKLFYIHTGLQLFPALQVDYFDWTTGAGIAYKIRYFDNFKLYGGGRLGIIFREKYPYSTYGAEFGLDYNLTEKIIIGLRSTYDYRSDFKYYGAPADWRFSTFVKFGIIL